MKASEIVSKLKEVLLSSEEVVEETVAEEQKLEEIPVVAEELSGEVAEELSEEVQEEAAEELAEDVVEEAAEAPAEEMSYATREELAEVKAMVEALMEKMEAKAEVPEELSSQEPEVEGLTHSPENASESKAMHLYAQKQPMTTLDRVLSKLSK